MIQRFTRILGSDSKGSLFQGRNPSPGRHRAAICVESLEGRKLLSGNIPGVTNYYGLLTISATQTTHNTALVTTDPATGGVEVSLNGQTEEFPAGSIWTIGYTGGEYGGDSFTNNTAVQDSVTMYGGNDTVLGGSSWNSVYLFGNNSSFDARGGTSYVYTYGGPNDHIVSYSNVTVFGSSYDPESLYFPTPAPTPTPRPSAAPSPTPTTPTITPANPAATRTGWTTWSSTPMAKAS